jgi:hypothetical protein
MQIPCVYIPGPAPAVSVANNSGCIGAILNTGTSVEIVYIIVIGQCTVNAKSYNYFEWFYLLKGNLEFLETLNIACINRFIYIFIIYIHIYIYICMKGIL